MLLRKAPVDHPSLISACEWRVDSGVIKLLLSIVFFNEMSVCFRFYVENIFILSAQANKAKAGAMKSFKIGTYASYVPNYQGPLSPSLFM